MMIFSSSWKLAVKASLLLLAGLTATKPVSHRPTLSGRQEPAATTSVGDVTGSATTTVSSATQSNSDIGVQVAENLLDLIDVDGWCENLDTSDPDELIRIWEDKGVAIMMDAYTNGQGDGWLKRLADHALPRSGDAGYDGCGVIGGSCDMSLDCDTMAARFMGMEYWILKAVEGVSGEQGPISRGTAADGSKATTKSFKSPMSSFWARSSTTSSRWWVATAQLIYSETISTS